MNTVAIAVRAKELAAVEGATVAKIKAQLVLDDYKAKDIAKAIKDLGLSKERANDFRGDFFNYLLTEAPETEAEVMEYIKANGTENIIKHAPVYIGEWKFANRLRAAVVAKMEAEAAKPKPKGK